MSDLIIKVDGVQYPYPDPGTVEMGDFRTIKREYGLVSLNDLNLQDPEHACALAFLAIRNANRTLPKQAVIDQLDRAKSIDMIAPEAAPAVPPPAPAEHVVAEPPAPIGS